MLSSKTIKGNLLEQQGILVQQVNCKGVMGAGLAKQIRSTYPSVYTQYKEVCTKYGSKALGGTLMVEVGEDTYVANIFSQDGYGRDKVYTDYIALQSCLSKVAAISKEHCLTIYIPYKIGCGLAGGDWNKVQLIIKDSLKDCKYFICKL